MPSSSWSLEIRTCWKQINSSDDDVKCDKGKAVLLKTNKTVPVSDDGDLVVVGLYWPTNLGPASPSRRFRFIPAPQIPN
jgi:hypothetical protein